MIDSTFLNISRWVSGALRPLVFGTICLWLLPQLGWGQAGRDEVLEGNGLFAEGRFEEAHEKYQQALDEDPSSAAIRYNLGDAEYKKSLYEEAIQAYQDALRINPDDRDAKHNLEFVRSKLEEQEQQDKQEDKQEDQDQDQKDKKDQDQSQNEDGSQDKNQEGEQEQDSQDQASQQKQPEQQQDSGSEKADSQSMPKMSKEEAERLLEALNERGNELKKQRLTTKGTVPVEKDW